MQQEPYYDDEIDLREIIQTLLKGWKVILLLTLLAGAIAFGISKLETPVYEASATVSIDQMALSLSANPASILLGGEMRQAVAEVLDSSARSLPLPGIVNDKTDQTLFIITTQSTDAQFAAEVANAWAETGVIYFAERASSAALLEYAHKLFTEADQAFLDYLENNNLSDMAWGELVWLTGIGNEQALPPERILPKLTRQERLDLTALMQARVAAEGNYTELAMQAAELQSAFYLNPPVILDYAETPATPVSPKTLINTALGISLGLMLGVFWVFIAGCGGRIVI